MSALRAVGALVAGAVAWKAVVMLATLAGERVWLAYAAVEEQRIFTLDMLLSRLAVGALATLVFGAVAAWVARGDARTVRVILFVWLIYSIVDHYSVWSDFAVWYHLVYLAYIAPLALLGAQLVERAKQARKRGVKA